MTSRGGRGGPAGPGQLGGDGGGQQGGVGADGHEPPAFGVAGGRGRAVADQQPAGLAVAVGGVADPLERGQVDGRAQVEGDAEVEAQVLGADEQDVDPVDGGDLLDLLDGGRRLDLDHPQDLVAGPGQGGRVEGEAAGPVVGGHAAVAFGGVAQVPDRLGDLGGGVHAGQHDPGRAQVQDPADADPGPGLDPDQGGHAVGPGG